MSSFSWQIQDLTQFDIAYWLPPGGKDNGVWADTWAIIADLESDDVAEVLNLLAEADVGGYVAIPGGRSPGHEDRSPKLCGWIRCSTTAPRTC